MRVFEANWPLDDAAVSQDRSAERGEPAATSTILRFRPATQIDFSVVVCTYSRAELLRGCLQSLVALDYPPQRYEIVVVDNNSNDETAELVAAFPAVKYVLEREQGLSTARNR